MKTENYVFISYLDSDYSRTSVYLNDSRKQNYFFWKVQGTKIRKIQSLVTLSMKYSRGRTTFVVMSPCHSLVIPLRFLTLKPIILDAGWSLSEALQVRNLGPKFLGHRIQTYFIDFLSFHLSNISIFESKRQCASIRHRFLLRKSKLRFIFTGFNEATYKNLIPVMPEELTERNEFQKDYILFRGSFTNEAGLDILREITQSSEVVDNQFVIATNIEITALKNCKNVLLLQRRLTQPEIKFLYLNCSLAIGQIRNTPRLVNTIPHKAFEAAYFAKPYLTADASGIREFLPNNNQAIFTNSEDPTVLTNLLKQRITDRELLLRTGVNAKTRYDQVASQQKLQDQFFEILNELNRS